MLWKRVPVLFENKHSCPPFVCFHLVSEHRQQTCTKILIFPLCKLYAFHVLLMWSWTVLHISHQEFTDLIPASPHNPSLFNFFAQGLDVKKKACTYSITLINKIICSFVCSVWVCSMEFQNVLSCFPNMSQLGYTRAIYVFCSPSLPPPRPPPPTPICVTSNHGY